MLAYGDLLENKDDFFTSLVENFTYDGDFYCAPKDFSTLALIINDDLWDAAGLTEADYPKDWDELVKVSEKLTEGDAVGLAFGAEYARVGAFMAQAGGGIVKDGKAIADSEHNVKALDFIKKNLDNGNFAFAADVGAGWGGEAFGKELAAMVVEGNWITGAMENDFPDVSYTVVELPADEQKGTLQFTNCWGIATDSPNQQGALELVEYLTSTEQQLAFSKAFGVMPSIRSAADEWKVENPEMAAFIDGADYAQFIPPVEGIAEVISDFNAQLETLKTADSEAILQTVQNNLEPLLG